MKNYFKELQEVLLTKDEIEIRPAHEFNENGFTLVPYKNRNTDKNILDRIVGPENWQKGHNGRAEMCYVEIWDESKSQWIRKENFGGMQEANGYRNKSEKAIATDALKRAGEDWGIGRELYTAPKIFISSPMLNAADYNPPKWTMPADVAMKYSNDNIVVKELASEIIDGAKTMTKIVLAFADDGVVFYEWERGKDAEAGKVKKARKKSAAASTSAPAEPAAEANAEETEVNAPEEAEAQSPAEAEAPAEQTEDPLASYAGDPLDAPLTLNADYPSDGSLAPYIGKPIRVIPEGHLSIVLRGTVPWSNIMSEAMFRLIEKAFLGE